jgi:hypothetical protein
MEIQRFGFDDLSQVYSSTAPMKLKWDKEDKSTMVYILFEGPDTTGTSGSIAFVNYVDDAEGFVSVSYIVSRIAQKGYATILLTEVIRHSLTRPGIHHVSLEDAAKNGCGPKLYGEKMLKHFKVEQEDKLYKYSNN